MDGIRIKNATQNYLKSVSLDIPYNKLIVVTGVSGSGKSSLVYDVLAAEGQRLFFDHFLSAGSQVHFKKQRPEVGEITGLHPVVVVNQQMVVRNSRSTVGTLTEIYDYLRLLYARKAESQFSSEKPARSLFSFNSPHGQCPVCKGLGVEDHIDPELIVGDATKTIREGALVLTTPNHYIIYSQVTMDELDKVCRAEGFNVDIPWENLTPENKDVIWNGSEKITVLFGKHTLESRLKWSGITAKPREESYYKGIIPVMEDILKRDRNPNIMRFARSFTCPECHGARINERARSFMWQGKSIIDFTAMTVEELDSYFRKTTVADPVVKEVAHSILRRTSVLLDLGTGHLQLGRESSGLSGGEAQRIRLANQAAVNLRNILYILDEPSAGLHPLEQKKLIRVMRQLVDSGNTVIAVEHDESTMFASDWIIDIGPGPGKAGGEILYNGPLEDFLKQTDKTSPTQEYLKKRPEFPLQKQEKTPDISFTGANCNNLKNIDISFCSGAFNVITGVSGAGKSSVIKHLMEQVIPQQKGGSHIFKKIIHIDQSPIGRSPKSNPATYTGLSDHIRDLLAAEPEAKRRGYIKGRFSFVVKGGRCEDCGGAGVQQIGMHFLGNVEVLCETCNGKRFTDETLEINYKGKNIFEILEMSVDEAHEHFAGLKKILTYTRVLKELGLGYLKLGQSSTTLSGGEAQRIKLAAELVKESGSQSLFILDEPTTGLHAADTEVLCMALRNLCARGHTVLCVEHDPRFILQSDYIIDMGPGSGAAGGNVVFMGSVTGLFQHKESLTAQGLIEAMEKPQQEVLAKKPVLNDAVSLTFKGVRTNRLKNIEVDIAPGKLTTVTGPSGSGKSSLVFDTIFAECQRRLMDGMSSYVRQFIGKTGNPVFDQATGLMPAIALQKKSASGNPRSTIGTYTGIYDLYRLLFSRFSDVPQGFPSILSSAFSFNHDDGACPVCKGIGTKTVADPSKFITDSSKSLLDGALDGTTTGKFYGNPFGQYVSALKAVGKSRNIDFSVSWNELDSNARDIAINGCGDEVFEVSWEYKRGRVEGVHEMKTTWPGFCGHIEEEYFRKHADARGEAMLYLMKHVPCENCNGYRLKPESLTYLIHGLHIGELCEMAADQASVWFASHTFAKGSEQLISEVRERLSSLVRTGIGYMAINRLTSTMSGGEYQRLRLSGLLKTPLQGILYLLDEPSFGLSRSDAARMTSVIAELKNAGNTILIADHSKEILEVSDSVIEMGPAAGAGGGEILSHGAVAPVLKKLQEYKTEPVFYNQSQQSLISVNGAYANNLKHISATFPKGALTVITGNSGSGKTSLLQHVVFASIQAGQAMYCKSFEGQITGKQTIFIGQEVATGSSLSVPATWLGIFDIVRKVFAAAEASSKAGLTASHFSFHTREGQCPDCKGYGVYRTAMDFWNDSEVLCETCKGQRYSLKSLSVSVGGKTIADVLAMSFDELAQWTEPLLKGKDQQVVKKVTDLVRRTGLGYISLGQQLSTLSSGEMQRMKLVSGMSEAREKSLYLLDEPTGGLHPSDTLKLIQLFDQLLKDGNTIVCATHDELLMTAAAKVIQL